MVIKPSKEIRNNYRQVADYCIETGQPVFLTNNGEGELVVMSIQSWLEERHRIRAEEVLLQIEEAEKKGIAQYASADTVIANMDRIINKAENNTI